MIMAIFGDPGGGKIIVGIINELNKIVKEVD